MEAPQATHQPPFAPIAPPPVPTPPPPPGEGAQAAGATLQAVSSATSAPPQAASPAEAAPTDADAKPAGSGAPPPISVPAEEKGVGEAGDGKPAGGDGAGYLDAVPDGGYSGPGATKRPPKYSQEEPNTMLRWEARIKSGSRLYHVGRYLRRGDAAKGLERALAGMGKKRTHGSVFARRVDVSEEAIAAADPAERPSKLRATQPSSP